MVSLPASSSHRIPSSGPSLTRSAALALEAGYRSPTALHRGVTCSGGDRGSELPQRPVARESRRPHVTAHGDRRPNGSGKTSALRAIGLPLSEFWPSMRRLRIPQDFTRFDASLDLCIEVTFDPPLVHEDTLGKSPEPSSSIYLSTERRFRPSSWRRATRAPTGSAGRPRRPANCS